MIFAQEQLIARLREDPLARLFLKPSSDFTLPACLLLSGAGALTFQVLWTRQMSLVLGATSPALAGVAAAFILALAAGSALAARFHARGSAALRAYAALEAGAGLAGLAASGLLLLKTDALSAWGGAWGGFPLALALAGPAAFLMGASFPAALNAFDAREAVRRSAFLYGINALGASLGALLCGFWAVGALGVLGTAALACGLHAAAAAAALAAAARWPQPRETPAAAAAPVEPAWLALAAVSGLCGLSYEVLWGRVARLFLGDRTQATAALLGITLAALALGGAAARPLSERLKATSASRRLSLAAWLMAAAGFAHLAGLKLVQLVIEGRLFAAAGHSAFWRAAAAALALGPATAALGTVLPLLLSGAEDPAGRPARPAGRLLAASAAASALGALSGALLLPRSLGTLHGMLSVSLLLCATAAACLWANSPPRRAAGRAAAALALALAGWLLLPARLLPHRADETLLLSHEDEYGLQVVTRDARGLLKLRNNRIGLANKLGEHSTSYAQESAAYFSCLLAASCEDVLNIGTGYGITAGAFLRFPQTRRLTTVEILPLVLDLQPSFRAFNFTYYADPRAERVHADGRHYLAASDRRYDAISVNVLDPYLPGSASLFTVDFWKLARGRLKPGGVYTQLVWGPDLPLLVKGLSQVFPRVLYFPAYGNSFNAVAFQDDAEPPARWERWTGPVAAALARLGVSDPRAFGQAALTAARRWETRLAQRAAETAGPLHTDARPILETRWSHGDSALTPFDSLQTSD